MLMQTTSTYQSLLSPMTTLIQRTLIYSSARSTLNILTQHNLRATRSFSAPCSSSHSSAFSLSTPPCIQQLTTFSYLFKRILINFQVYTSEKKLILHKLLTRSQSNQLLHQSYHPQAISCPQFSLRLLPLATIHGLLISSRNTASRGPITALSL